MTFTDVVNKLDKSLKPFEFDANKLPMDEITNELWNTIGSMTASNWIDILESLHSSKKIKNKENIPVNV